jgi:metal-dependent HD superfamily phosphatase/phosphodiesterase
MSIQKNLWYVFNEYWKVYNMVADMKLMSTRHGYTHAAITVPHTTDIAEILLKLALNTN